MSNMHVSEEIFIPLSKDYLANLKKKMNYLMLETYKTFRGYLDSFEHDSLDIHQTININDGKEEFKLHLIISKARRNIVCTAKAYTGMEFQMKATFDEPELIPTKQDFPDIDIHPGPEIQDEKNNKITRYNIPVSNVLKNAIIEDLLRTSLPISEIADKHNVKVEYVRLIQQFYVFGQSSNSPQEITQEEVKEEVSEEDTSEIKEDLNNRILIESEGDDYKTYKSTYRNNATRYYFIKDGYSSVFANYRTIDEIKSHMKNFTKSLLSKIETDLSQELTPLEIVEKYHGQVANNTIFLILYCCGYFVPRNSEYGKLSDDQKYEIAIYLRDHTDKDTMKKFNIRIYTLLKIKKNFDIHKCRNFSDEQLIEMCRMYQEDKDTYESVASHYNISACYARYLINKHYAKYIAKCEADQAKLNSTIDPEQLQRLKDHFDLRHF